MRVLDCSIAMAGPLAAMRLGDLGADVVKVEPVTGEWQRHVAGGGATGNRDQRVLPLAQPQQAQPRGRPQDERGARVAAGSWSRTADVFLQNYRPGVAERLGVDYETLQALNPDSSTSRCPGYGENGPYAHRPGQDLLLQAMSGALLSAGRSGDPPQPAGQFLVDAITAYSAFEGALAALLHRERTGEGQLVQVNMLDAIIDAADAGALGLHRRRRAADALGRAARATPTSARPYGIFETTDGYLALAFPTLASRRRARRARARRARRRGRHLDAPRRDLRASPRERLLTRDERRLARGCSRRRGFWAGPVYGYEDVVDDAQVEHNGTFVDYDHPTEGAVTHARASRSASRARRRACSPARR